VRIDAARAGSSRRASMWQGIITTAQQISLAREGGLTDDEDGRMLLIGGGVYGKGRPDSGT